MNPDVLVVSENPKLIHHAFDALRPYGMNVIGCLGPALGPCKLEANTVCSLAAHSSVVVIDSPASGSFSCHGKVIPAADYAAQIAERHSACFPILCGAPVGTSGATGDTAQAVSAISAIEMLRQIARAACLEARAVAPRKEGVLS
jgi:hypothetical protein